MSRFSIAALRDFSNRVFIGAGVFDADAEIITDTLIHADLRGHASHGVTRIPIYLERLVKGAVNPAPDVRIDQPTPSLIVVDGDNGAGPVVGVKALDAAIAVAKAQGVCAAFVAHSNHNGTGAYYVERAIAADCIAVSMTNAPPSMAVFGGRTPTIGTNPIAFGVPVEGATPMILDMATSVVARGKIVEAAKRAESIPEGWALDADGAPTTDAIAAERGVVLPMSGAKGSALALMVETLCGILPGGRFAGGLGNLYSQFDISQDIGHFFLVLDLGAMRKVSNVESRMATLAAEVKAGPKAAGFTEILMPGEPETRKANQARMSGIELPDNVVRDLDEAAATVGVAPINEFAEAL